MSTEHSVGIKAFASPGDGFAAATKQRFSDFIVREVGLDGKVVRLTTLPEAPDEKAQKQAATDAASSAEPQLAALLGEAQAKSAIALHATASGSGSKESDEAQTLVLERDDDKDHRRDVHRIIKELLPHLTTDTVDSPDGGG